MKSKILCMILCFLTARGFAANPDSVKANNSKKYNIIPMPVIAANPTTGLIFGVAPGVSWYSSENGQTSMSNFLGSFLYTTKKQLFLQARGNMFLENDAWILTSDIRYNLNSQPTYGLGTKAQFADSTTLGGNTRVSDNLFDGPNENEMMAFNHFRLYQIANKRHKDTRFFYGLGYHLDVMSKIDDQELALDSIPKVITNHYQYQSSKGLSTTQYTQSGISLNASFDSRDNVANPYSGRLAAVSFRINPSFLGSTGTTTQLWVEYRDYFHLSKTRQRNLLAFWTYGWFVTSGDVPYLFLPATGWDMFGRSARPYTQGRFRGEGLMYSEAEWRFPLQKNKEKFGGVLFVNVTSASNRDKNLKIYESAFLGYGGGLRYMLSEKNRINISLDYGIGHNGASAIFLNLNEMF